MDRLYAPGWGHRVLWSSLCGLVVLAHAGVLYLLANPASAAPPIKQDVTLMHMVEVRPAPPPVEPPPPPAPPPPPPPPKVVKPKPTPKPLPKPPPPPPKTVPVSTPPPTVTPPTPPPPVTQPPEPAPPPVIEPRFSAAYLNNTPPPYPPMSRRLQEEGTVMLRVWVKSDGCVGKIKVVASSGYSRLDTAAQQAVKRWRFEPARQGDAAIGAWVKVPVRFDLN